MKMYLASYVFIDVRMSWKMFGVVNTEKTLPK